MSSAILLIGPLCAGKSTVGRLLAEKLDLPQSSLDGLPLEFFLELGFDAQQVETLKETQGWLAAYLYMQRFSVRAIERLLHEERRHVIDFGAPYSTFQDDSLLARVQAAFEPCREVVLLLPSPDLDESVRVVKERMRQREGHAELRGLLQGLRDETGVDYEELYVKHPSNFQLARNVVYTKGKTPEQTRDEIVELLGT
jgi:adenylate kinase family enzyme